MCIKETFDVFMFQYVIYIISYSLKHPGPSNHNYKSPAGICDASVGAMRKARTIACGCSSNVQRALSFYIVAFFSDSIFCNASQVKLFKVKLLVGGVCFEFAVSLVMLLISRIALLCRLQLCRDLGYI